MEGREGIWLRLRRGEGGRGQGGGLLEGQQIAPSQSQVWLAMKSLSSPSLKNKQTKCNQYPREAGRGVQRLVSRVGRGAEMRGGQGVQSRGRGMEHHHLVPYMSWEGGMWRLWVGGSGLRLTCSP